MADPQGGPPVPGGTAPADPNDGIWPYLGVGCITTVSGFFGGGMIAVLIAKVVGAATRCTPDAESGAPCNWFDFAKYGFVIGGVLFPAVAIWLLRRSRQKRRTT